MKFPAGFRQNDFGEWIFKGECQVNLYCTDSWEIDIVFPDGNVIAGDMTKFSIGPAGSQSAPLVEITATDIEQAKKPAPERRHLKLS